MRDMLIARLSDLLASFDNIDFAYLFGSYVDGNISKHSDLDIS